MGDRCMGDVLAMIQLEHIHAVKLNIGEMCLSDQEMCDIMRQAEGLAAVITLDLNHSEFSGAGLGAPNISLKHLERVILINCRSLADTGVQKVVSTSGSTLKILVH